MFGASLWGLVLQLFKLDNSFNALALITWSEHDSETACYIVVAADMGDKSPPTAGNRWWLAFTFKMLGLAFFGKKEKEPFYTSLHKYFP